MIRLCPNKLCTFPENFIKDGLFRRREDSKTIQRYRCKTCGLRFSNSTFQECYKQKKRRLNFSLVKLLSSGVSMRRSAIILGVNKKTIERKLPFLANKCRRSNAKKLLSLKRKLQDIQIDDLITKENSKLKPLTVTIAVDESSRTILAAEVSQIPSFGHLSKISILKYGKRKDMHEDGLTKVFTLLSKIASPEVVIKSDEHQRYPCFISSYLPKAKHITFKSERACVVGQGELKKLQFDPLFAVNHTCATLRANINRLIRKTWCTTKDPARLKDHLDIFIFFHNHYLLSQGQHHSSRAVFSFL